MSYLNSNYPTDLKHLAGKPSDHEFLKKMFLAEKNSGENKEYSEIQLLRKYKRKEKEKLRPQKIKRKEWHTPLWNLGDTRMGMHAACFSKLVL